MDDEKRTIEDQALAYANELLVQITTL
jgi:hypothetical protein